MAVRTVLPLIARLLHAQDFMELMDGSRRILLVSSAFSVPKVTQRAGDGWHSEKQLNLR